jgi:hypothetical protein
LEKVRKNVKSCIQKMYEKKEVIIKVTLEAAKFLLLASRYKLMGGKFALVDVWSLILRRKSQGQFVMPLPLALKSCDLQPVDGDTKSER